MNPAKINWAEISSEESEGEDIRQPTQSADQQREKKTEEGPNSAQNIRNEGNYKYKKDRPYDYKKPRTNREGGDRPKKPQSNSAAEDIVRFIQNTDKEPIHINLCNLHYDVQPDDIYDFYGDIQFEIDYAGRGYFAAVFESKSEAIRFARMGTGVNTLEWLG